MFQFIYDVFSEDPGFFRIFNYVTFRALMAGLTSMLLMFVTGKTMIIFLYKLKFKESVRNDGPSSHASKSGTPTMGGLMIALSLLFSVLLWGNFKNVNLIVLLFFSLCFAALGFIDDYTKSVKKVKGGMKARIKFILSIVISGGFSYLFFYVTGQFSLETKGITFSMSDIFIPFFKGPVADLGLFILPFSVLVIISTSHAVNLTDGLDGLASGTTAIVTVTLGIISYVSGTPVAANYLNLPYLPGAHEYSVFLSALTGSLIGFLWFNSHPAQVFMGDTGSLFLGATLGMVSVMIKKEFLLLILGGIFVAEALSVILQVGSFKLRKKRIFKMAPLHHHFELSGMVESKIVIRFWILGIILALISLSTLKIQ